LRFAIAKQLQEGWGIALLFIPYNHKSMEQLARLRARLEREHALLTGYLP
jgi:hypothetical protein